MASAGTLFGFVVVSFSVMILRKTRPDLKRSFTCPAVYLIAPLAILTCSYLIYTLLLETKGAFLIWIAIGIVVYFSYSYHNSALNEKSETTNE